MDKKQEKLTIIIVNYNSTSNLNKLIKSLDYINDITSQILVIDNNSRDISKLEQNNKKIKLIKNKSNLGFSKAVNQGIKLSKNNLILLINPDCTLIDSSPLSTYNKLMSDNKIGAIGGRILNQYTANSKPGFFTGLFEFTNLKKIFLKNRFSKQFWIENNEKSSQREVFSLCGAYTFLRKHGKSHINYLDERFFMYLEDLDLGYTIQNNGQKVVFDPDSHVHHVGGSSNSSKYRIVLKYWYGSRKKFFLKNLPKYQGYTLYIIFTVEEILLKLIHMITNTPNE